MPRLAQTLPKYRKYRASKQAIVTLAGVDFYLSPHGTKASRILYGWLVTVGSFLNGWPVAGPLRSKPTCRSPLWNCLPGSHCLACSAVARCGFLWGLTPGLRRG